MAAWIDGAPPRRGKGSDGPRAEAWTTARGGFIVAFMDPSSRIVKTVFLFSTFLSAFPIPLAAQANDTRPTISVLDFTVSGISREESTISGCFTPSGGILLGFGNKVDGFAVALNVDFLPGIPEDQYSYKV